MVRPVDRLPFSDDSGAPPSDIEGVVGQKNEEAKLPFDGAAEFLGWRSLEPVRMCR